MDRHDDPSAARGRCLECGFNNLTDVRFCAGPSVRGGECNAELPRVRLDTDGGDLTSADYVSSADPVAGTGSGDVGHLHHLSSVVGRCSACGHMNFTSPRWCQARLAGGGRCRTALPQISQDNHAAPGNSNAHEPDASIDTLAAEEENVGLAGDTGRFGHVHDSDNNYPGTDNYHAASGTNSHINNNTIASNIHYVACCPRSPTCLHHHYPVSDPVACVNCRCNSRPRWTATGLVVLVASFVLIHLWLLFW